MWMALAAAALLVGAPARCPQPVGGGPPPEPVVDPDWLMKPSFQEIWWAYPPKARWERVPGSATLSCEVNLKGRLENCIVIAEDPSGYGFGAAAIVLTEKMTMRPKMVCGEPARGKVRIPLVFSIPEDAPLPEPLDPSNPKASLAARLVAAAGFESALRDAVDDAVLGMIDEISEDRETTAEERMMLDKAAHESWRKVEPKVTGAVASAFAIAMSEDELRKAVDFFESPAGQKIIQLQGKMMDVLEKALEQVQPEAHEEFQRIYCERLQALCAADDAI